MTPLRKSNRIDVWDWVKCLEKEPREELRLEVERLRQVLTADLIRLQSLQSNLNHPGLTLPDEPYDESFDSLDDEIDGAEPSAPDQLIDITDPNQIALLPECRPLHLPSSHRTIHSVRPS